MLAFVHFTASSCTTNATTTVLSSRGALLGSDAGAMLGHLHDGTPSALPDQGYHALFPPIGYEELGAKLLQGKLLAREPFASPYPFLYCSSNLHCVGAERSQRV
jgi:hypothetical protein